VSWLLAGSGLALAGACAALLGALRGISRARIAEAIPDDAARERFLALLEEERAFAFTAVVLRALGFATGALGIATLVLLGRALEPLLVLETVGLLFLALGLADTVPRALGAASPERFLARTLPTYARIARLVFPVIALFKGATGVVLILTDAREPTEAEEIVSSLRSAALEGVSEGLLDPTATNLIERALGFQDKDVSDIMTPRTEIVAVPANAPLPDVIKLLAETKLSRIPVFEETLDRVVGVFYAKDILARELVEGGVRALMRKPVFVPETKKVSELLKEFRRGRPHIVIVVDEHGGTAGIVTFADVVEEIVGYVRDEDEVAEGPRIRRTPDGAFEVAGAVRTGELLQELGVAVPDDPDYETVAGFVLARLGRIPQKGEVITEGGLRVQVLDADERRVKRVRLARSASRA
jgi:CBS domain containing-hemolysin-like protein